jgi:hypothetical protein
MLKLLFTVLFLCHSFLIAQEAGELVLPGHGVTIKGVGAYDGFIYGAYHHGEINDYSKKVLGPNEYLWRTVTFVKNRTCAQPFKNLRNQRTYFVDCANGAAHEDSFSSWLGEIGYITEKDYTLSTGFTSTVGLDLGNDIIGVNFSESLHVEEAVRNGDSVSNSVNINTLDSRAQFVYTTMQGFILYSGDTYVEIYCKNCKVNSWVLVSMGQYAKDATAQEKKYQLPASVVYHHELAEYLLFHGKKIETAYYPVPFTLKIPSGVALRVSEYNPYICENGLSKSKKDELFKKYNNYIMGQGKKSCREVEQELSAM